jgi:hypothetical protein
MAENLRQVGVQLVALGGSEYVAALNAAAQAEAQLTASLVPLANSEKALSTALVPIVSSLQEATKGYQDTARAVNADEVAEASKIQIALQQLAVFQQLNAEFNQTNVTVTSNTDVLNINTKAAAAASQHTGSFVAAVRGMRFALMEGIAVLAMYQIAIGETLPQAAREASRAMMIVGDSIMAAAMVSATAASVGIGALVGVVLALGVASLTVDEDLSALNKQLDSLAKHDAATEGLRNLAAVEADVAANALEWMKLHPELAAELQDMEKLSQKSMFAVSGLGDALGWLVGKTGEVVRVWQAMAIADQAYLEAIREGKSHQEAQNIAIQAGHDVVMGYSQAVQDASHQLVLFADAAERAYERLAPLDSIFASIANQNAAIDLMAQFTSLSHEEAAVVLDEVSSHKELAGELAKQVQLVEQDIIAIEALTAAGMDASNAIYNLQVHTEALNDALAQFRNAVAYAEALEDFAKLAENAAKAQADILKAQRDTDVARAQSRRQLSEQLDELAFRDAENEIKYQQNVAKANRSLNDDIYKANRDLSDAMADNALRLADSEFDAQRTLTNALNDLAYDHLKDEQAIAQGIVNARIKAADDIESAWRDMLEALAALDWQTGQDVQDAKTANEKEKILERATFERAQVQQKFADSLLSANNDITNAMRVAKTKEELADEDYAHQMDLDTRRYREQLADAERTFAETTASAQRSNREQIADAQLRNAEQLSDLQQSLDNEARMLEHQRMVVQQNNANRLSDLDARLAREMEDIDARYQHERDQILATTTYAEQMYLYLIAFQQTLDIIGGVMNSLSPTAEEMTGGMAAGGVSGIPSRDLGGAVAAGQAVYVGGPEIFVPQTAGTMVPMNNVRSVTGNTFNFMIPATNPQAYAEAVRVVMEQEVWH